MSDKLKHDVRVLEMMTNKESTTDCTLAEGFIREGYEQWELDNLAPNTRYAVLMVPIPDGMRLAKDGERGHGLMGNNWATNMMNTTVFKWDITNRNWGSPDFISITPIKSERDKKREALQVRLARAEAEVAEVRKDMDEL